MTQGTRVWGSRFTVQGSAYRGRLPSVPGLRAAQCDLTEGAGCLPRLLGTEDIGTLYNMSGHMGVQSTRPYTSTFPRYPTPDRRIDLLSLAGQTWHCALHRHCRQLSGTLETLWCWHALTSHCCHRRVSFGRITQTTTFSKLPLKPKPGQSVFLSLSLSATTHGRELFLSSFFCSSSLGVGSQTAHSPRCAQPTYQEQCSSPSTASVASPGPLPPGPRRDTTQRGDQHRHNAPASHRHLPAANPRTGCTHRKTPLALPLPPLKPTRNQSDTD